MMMRMLGLAEIILFLLILGVIFFVYFSNTQQGKNKRKNSPDAINWEAANDHTLRALLPHQQIEAIERYREMTGVGLKTAKSVVEYLIAHPDDFGGGEKEKIIPRDAGVRDLVREGRIKEAIAIYRDFTGASDAEAAQDIAQIEQELLLEADAEFYEDKHRPTQNQL